MRITVYYENGLTEDFDTLNFTNGEPFRSDGSKNVLTDFQLRFDFLDTKGLVLDVYYYEAPNANSRQEAVEELGVRIPVAARRLGWRAHLVAKEELDRAVLIMRDGETFAWKQGDDWINAVKFRLQEILCFSSASTDSTNRKATVLFDYLRKAHPDYTDEEVAQLMGYSLEAYRRIQEWETQNIDFDDEGGGSSGGSDGASVPDSVSEEEFPDSREEEPDFPLDDTDFPLETS